MLSHNIAAVHHDIVRAIFMPDLICRIRIRMRFSESIHLVHEPESGFANTVNPVLTWIL